MLKEDIFDSGLSKLIRPVALFYELLIRLRLVAYKKRVFKKRRLPGFVLSIGNITMGGTGKTPAVMEIAAWARDKGYKVGVLSRGYKGSYKGWALVSDGEDIWIPPEQAGDEPYLMARNLKGVVIALSKKRYVAGMEIARRYGVDFFVLDDGFQHIMLERDMDILLLNGERPFGNRKIFPSGPLREPLDQIDRADLYVITGEKRIPPEVYSSNKAVFFAHHFADHFISPEQGIEMPAHQLRGKRIGAFSGIATPERFQRTLEDLGANLVFFRVFPDHHWFKDQEINGLLRLKQEKGAEYLVTTEKDWVRIMDKKWNIGYIKIRLRIDEKERFFDLIDERYQTCKADTRKGHQLDW